MTKHFPKKGDQRRSPYPKGYRKDLVKLRTRADRRQIKTPGVVVRPSKNRDGSSWEPAHRGDDDYWWLKLADGFGTRSRAVIVTFMDQLIELSGGDEPDDTLVNAAISVIASYQPKNEGEAMLAAQMVAVNVLTMKAAAYANTAHGGWALPERETRLVFRGARAFAEQTDVMARLKGRKGEQHIHVHYEDNRQAIAGGVHVYRGPEDFGGPTRDAYDASSKPARRLPPGAHASSPPLRGPDAERYALPRPEGEGPAALSLARLWSWIGRATGRGQRVVQARGLDGRSDQDAQGSGDRHARLPPAEG